MDVNDPEWSRMIVFRLEWRVDAQIGDLDVNGFRACPCHSACTSGRKTQNTGHQNGLKSRPSAVHKADEC